MITISQTVNGLLDLAVGGKYFRLLKTSAPVDVRLYKNGQIVTESLAVDQGYYDQPPTGFDRISITSGSVQAVKMAVTDGTGGYDRLTVDIASNSSAPGNVTESAPVAVATAATLIVALDVSRKGLRIYNAGTDTVYLGGAGITTANACVRIAPGQTILENEAPAAAWYGLAASATQEVRVQVLS